MVPGGKIILGWDESSLLVKFACVILVDIILCYNTGFSTLKYCNSVFSSLEENAFLSTKMADTRWGSCYYTFIVSCSSRIGAVQKHVFILPECQIKVIQ